MLLDSSSSSSAFWRAGIGKAQDPGAKLLAGGGLGLDTDPGIVKGDNVGVVPGIAGVAMGVDVTAFVCIMTLSCITVGCAEPEEGVRLAKDECSECI